MRRLPYILLAMLLCIGCESNHDCTAIPDEPNYDLPSGGDDPGETEPTDPGTEPTQPLKKRPIVPGGKILRPRFTVLILNSKIEIHPEACNAAPMTITVRCETTGVEYSAVLNTEGDIMHIPCEELSGEVTIITSINDDVDVEFLSLDNKE